MKQTATYIIFGAIILATIVGIYSMKNGEANKQGKKTEPTKIEISAATVANVAKAMTLIIPDVNQQVSLVEGKAEYKIENEIAGGLTGSVILLEKPMAFKQTPTGTDILFYYSYNNGGTGMFDTIGLAKWDGVNAPKHVASYAIGDRLLIESIVIDETATPESYGVTVGYKTRNGDEPMVYAPTIDEKLKVSIKGNEIIEEK